MKLGLEQPGEPLLNGIEYAWVVEVWNQHRQHWFSWDLHVNVYRGLTADAISGEYVPIDPCIRIWNLDEGMKQAKSHQKFVGKSGGRGEREIRLRNIFTQEVLMANIL